MRPDKFTVQSTAPDFNLCDEMYFADIPDCIKWAVQHSIDCDCESFIIKNTDGAKSYLAGTQVQPGLINWDETDYPEVDIPFVKPTWGIWNSP